MMGLNHLRFRNIDNEVFQSPKTEKYHIIPSCFKKYDGSQ